METSYSDEELKEVYHEFWDEIPEENEIFEEFVRHDPRRIHFIK
jgi:hypothetical protein